jgi:hypothetical protein
VWLDWRAATYEPDALARCAKPLPPNALKLRDPIIIVWVLRISLMMHDLPRPGTLR